MEPAQNVTDVVLGCLFRDQQRLSNRPACMAASDLRKNFPRAVRQAPGRPNMASQSPKLSKHQGIRGLRIRQCLPNSAHERFGTALRQLLERSAVTTSPIGRDTPKRNAPQRRMSARCGYSKASARLSP